MSLESAIADLVSASTQLTQSVNVTRATVEATRDTVIAQEAPVTTAKDATTASATAATTDTATTASKLTAAAADYAAQKTTKGLAAVQTSADSELKDRLHRRDPARHPFRGARPSLVMDFVRRECHRNNAAGNLEQVDLSSFMTFTRGSTATYVGPDGLIKEAASNVPRYGYDPVTGEALGLLVEEQRTNLLPYSSWQGDSSWEKTNSYIIPNAALSPDGLLSAVKVVENAGTFGAIELCRTNISFAVGETKTLSVFVKRPTAGAARNFKLALNTGSIVAGSVTSNFDLDTGVASNTQNATAVMTYVGNGWYRCSITATATNAATTSCYFTLTNGATQCYTGDGVSGLYLWGAQLEAGSFPTSYIPTPATFTGRASTKTYFDSNGVLQTAASGVAVTDYGYVDGRWVSKGLSLEPQATNLFLQSINFASGWSKNGTFVTSTSTEPSPTGEFNAVTCTFHAETSNVSGFYSGITLTAGQTVTASVFVKPTNSDVFRFGFDGAVFGTNGYALFTFSTGSVYTNVGAGAPIIPTMKKLSGGWYRVSITRTAVADGTTLVVLYNGVGGASVLTLYGAQAEVGSYATSYIPTTTAQVTRAADTSTSAQVTRADESVALSTMANWYNRDNSTFCVGAQRHVSAGSDSRILTGPDATQNELIGIRPGNEIESYDGVGLVCALAGWNNLTPMRAGIVLGRAARKISGNGANVMSGAASSKLVDLSAIKIWPYTVTQPRAGYIRQLTYFPRQLSDADLQALTILED